MSENHDTPERYDLTGCTYEGRKLTGTEIGERERHSEFMEQHRKEVGDKVVILRQRHQKAKGAQEETKRVSRRTRHLTSDEIRKEYGIMEKPYKTHVENMLWLIVNKGPLGLREMAGFLEYEDFKKATRSLSGPLSQIWRVLGDGPDGVSLLKRHPEDGRNFYSVAGEVTSIETLFETYKERNRKILAKKRARARGEEPDNPENIESEEDQVQGIMRKTQEINTSPLGKAIEETVKKALGIEVQVNGRIEILFGWKRGE